MSRFSPTVLPTANPTFATALAQGFDQYADEREKQKQLKQQRQAAADTHLEREQTFVREGGRQGTAPDAGGTDITVNPNPTFDTPSTSDMGRALRGQPMEQPAPAPVEPGSPPSDADWSSALRGKQPAASPLAAPVPTPQATGLMLQGGAAHPGGFDPETRTFGGTQGRAAVEAAAAQPVVTHLAPSGRYAQIDPTHYQDTQGSESALNRASQHEFSMALAGQRIGGQKDLQEMKGEQAAGRTDAQIAGRSKLEEQRQGGRISLADVKNANAEDRDEYLQGYRQQNIRLAGDIHKSTAVLLKGMGVDATGNKPLTQNQTVVAQQHFLDLIGKAARGDPEEAVNILHAGGALGTTATKLGLGEDDVRRVTMAFGDKADAATAAQILKVVGAGGNADDVPGAKKTVDAAKGAGKTPRAPAPPAGSPPSGSTGTDPAKVKTAAAWKAANPRKAGESDEDYYARFNARKP